MTGLLVLCLVAAPQTRSQLVREARAALIQAERNAAHSGQACKNGEYEKCMALLDQTRSDVERAKQSLDQTGLHPSRNPRPFKDAEIRVRKILKLAQAVEPYIHPDDRNRYDAVIRRISDINDKLLSSILEKKRK